jgi:hypothetical protein
MKASSAIGFDEAERKATPRWKEGVLSRQTTPVRDESQCLTQPEPPCPGERRRRAELQLTVCMLYVHKRPAAPLDAFVDTIWLCRNELRSRMLERVLPSAASQLIVNLAEDATRLMHEFQEFSGMTPSVCTERTTDFQNQVTFFKIPGKFAHVGWRP